MVKLKPGAVPTTWPELQQTARAHHEIVSQVAKERPSRGREKKVETLRWNYRQITDAYDVIKAQPGFEASTAERAEITRTMPSHLLEDLA